jgi:hypothetical protein
MTLLLHGIRQLPHSSFEVEYEIASRRITGRLSRADDLSWNCSEDIFELPGFLAKCLLQQVVDFESGATLSFPFILDDGISDETPN